MQDRINRQVAARVIEHENGTAPEQHGLNAPQIKGAGKRANEEIERQVEQRIAKYKKPAVNFELGVYTKTVSMDDWMNEQEAAAASTGNNFVMLPQVDKKKTLGKM